MGWVIKTLFNSSHNGWLFLVQPGPRFNIEMSSYWYRKSHCGDKTVVRSSYLHNGISYTGKMTSLYWIMALVSFWHFHVMLNCNMVNCHLLLEYGDYFYYNLVSLWHIHVMLDCIFSYQRINSWCMFWIISSVVWVFPDDKNNIEI